VSRARDVAEIVIKALVDRPGEVRVTETPHRGGSLIEVFVGEHDLGRVIGRQGRTATAIRTLVAVTADGEGERATVEFRDEHGRR
jgi:predicted RNA-binding protein YlqC (UPF0109 family)